jgi:hypothetical protein
MNFIYNEKGKAEAEKGFHDDLIFGLGLALMGVEQAYYYEEEIKRMHRPINLTEVMQFEVATGCPINKVPEGYFADPTPFEEIVSNI